jgi:hypothetical protein
MEDDTEISVSPEAAQASQTEVSTAENNDEMAALSQEYPEILQSGKAVLPPEVTELTSGGMKLLDAYRLYDLKRVKRQYAELQTKYDAELESRANAAASVGSVKGGQAYEKDYYTSQEWDKLPQNLKEKFIKNGKIFEFMKKWSVHS